MAIKLHTKESLDLFNTIERVRSAAGTNQFTISLCGDLANLCAMIPRLTQERDEARQAYENETASTMDLTKHILKLESEVNHWRNKHSELFMILNPIESPTESPAEKPKHTKRVPESSLRPWGTTGFEKITRKN